MTDQTVLEFEYLAEDKNLSAKVRNLGNIPGVVYGDGEKRKISLQAKRSQKSS